MFRRHSTTVAIGTVCALTVLAHWWIAQHSVRRLERVTRAFEEIPLEVDEWTSFDLSEDQKSTFQETAQPRLLTAATYEEPDGLANDGDHPADALRTCAEDAPSLPIAESKPLTPRQKEELAAVREVIEEEMPETSAEERDIWFDELKSLPAEVVRDLLQVRKQLRVLTPGHALSGPSQLSQGGGQPLTEQEISAEPIAQSRPLPTDDWTSTRQALEQAIAWSTHNIANAATPGYKKWRVVLGDVIAPRGSADTPGEERFHAVAGGGCRIVSLSLDLTPGEIISTGRDLDLAIEGDGLFIVLHEKSKQFFYTRGGAWKLTADRRLACLIDGEDYLLDADLRIPTDTAELQIDQDGSVEVRLADQESFQRIGQIQLAVLPVPGSLISQGSGLLVSRHVQEPQREIPGTKGLGVLRQGSLEQSNVDLEQEQQERDDWQALLKLLPSTGLPRTARASDRTPR